jgi:hypothetical protein
MSRRIAGMAFDGRHDVAAIDWDEEDRIGPVRVLQAGTLADVVTTETGRLIAGPQAALAPHGRGGGWGDIADPRKRNRRPLSAAIDALGHNQNAADLLAAIDALARDAQEVVLAVPDLPGFDEAAQGAWLRAARGQGRRRVRLLWRPVAAMLGLIEDKLLDENELGRKFRFLIHAATGIEEQTLTLRRDPENPGHIAPQRDGPGRVFAKELGLDALFGRAARRVEQSVALDWARLEPSRLGPRLLVGEALVGDLEVLRDSSGAWHVLNAPRLDPVDLFTECEQATVPDAPDLEAFLITPLCSPYAEYLAKRLGHRIVTAGPELVARGCLRAGRLIERRLPHYFDRLESISIAANRSGEPAFVPLIPEGHLVAANREYVSPDFTEFVWPRGKPQTKFYILKGLSEIREWAVSREPAPAKEIPVTLRIRQTPGQSWAILDITARDWEPLARAPERLDWEGLKPTDKTSDQILFELRRPPPTIPERVVELAHRDLWLGSDWAGGDEALRLARQAAELGRVDAEAWAELLSRGQRHPDTQVAYRRVSTDGELPPGLPAIARTGFDTMLRVLGQSLLTGPRLTDNRPLQAVTWSFAACPAAVQDAILDGLAAHEKQKPHRLLAPNQAIRVLRQGAGRAICTEPRLRRLFAILVQGPLNTDTINALAMALSRRPEAPAALTRQQVDALLPRLSTELLDQVRDRSFNVRFKNTLSAIAGLFRWREREPQALLATNEPTAARLQATLREATELLRRPQWTQVPARQQKIILLEKIADYLVGKGDPAILRLIDDAN